MLACLSCLPHFTLLSTTDRRHGSNAQLLRTESTHASYRENSLTDNIGSSRLLGKCSKALTSCHSNLTRTRTTATWRQGPAQSWVNVGAARQRRKVQSTLFHQYMGGWGSSLKRKAMTWVALSRFTIYTAAAPSAVPPQEIGSRAVSNCSNSPQ